MTRTVHFVIANGFYLKIELLVISYYFENLLFNLEVGSDRITDSSKLVPGGKKWNYFKRTISFVLYF